MYLLWLLQHARGHRSRSAIGRVPGPPKVKASDRSALFPVVPKGTSTLFGAPEGPSATSHASSGGRPPFDRSSRITRSNQRCGRTSWTTSSTLRVPVVSPTTLLSRKTNQIGLVGTLALGHQLKASSGSSNGRTPRITDPPKDRAADIATSIASRSGMLQTANTKTSQQPTRSSGSSSLGDIWSERK
jgi:hypothetical protein